MERRCRGPRLCAQAVYVQSKETIMRSVQFMAHAGLLVLATTAAGGALSQDLTAQDQTIQVRGLQQTYKLQPQQMSEMAGVYRLDNGGVFRIHKVSNRLMAQLGERAMTELVAQDDGHLVSRDQRMTVDYIAQPFGDEIRLSYPLDLARADSPMVTVLLAAR
jgi:hypothetical protein